MVLNGNFVLIGSSVYNAYTARVLEACGFKFSFHPKIKDPFRNENYTTEEKNNIRWMDRLENGNWRPVVDDNGKLAKMDSYEYDLGILCRVRCGDATIVICAGNDAQSTIGCARFLKENITNLVKSQNDKDFAIVLGFKVSKDSLSKAAAGWSPDGLKLPLPKVPKIVAPKDPEEFLKVPVGPVAWGSFGMVETFKLT